MCAMQMMKIIFFVYINLSNSLASDSFNVYCPLAGNWTLSVKNGICYNVFKSDSSVTWTQAKSLCEGLGGILACVHDSETNELLRGLRPDSSRQVKINAFILKIRSSFYRL